MGKALLYQCYQNVQEVCDLSLESFFDYMFPNIPDITLCKKQKEEGIKDFKELYYKVYVFYLNRAKGKRIIKHLDGFVQFLGGNVDTVLNNLLEVVKENLGESMVEGMKNKCQGKDQSRLFYEVFWQCMKVEYKIISEERSAKTRKALDEFNDKVLKIYGLSGKTGRNFVVALARKGSMNPYILFEAAEILFQQGMNFFTQGKDGSDDLNTAYGFYKKASELDFALAHWAMGHMMQREFEGRWKIPALDNKSKDELLNMAFFYYDKAAEQKLAKAFRSLGNLACNGNIDEKVRKKLGAFKKYYLEAEKGKDVYGMYNYGRTLEREINECIKHKDSSEIWKEPEIKKAQRMLKDFEESAEMGYPLANYRCALYYGGLSDEKTIPLEERKGLLLEKDNEKTVSYFKRMVDKFSELD